MKKRVPPTPAEMNKTHREFWDATSAEFEASLRRRPGDAVIAAEQEAEATLAAGVDGGTDARDAAIRQSPSMEKRVADLGRAHQLAQQAKARKPRPKRKPTVRTETIAAMASARRDGMEFQDFLDSAQAGSASGISVSRLDRRGVERFLVIADAVTDRDGEQEVSAGTLRDWWGKAGKKLTTD